MTYAIRLHETGDASKLCWEEITLDAPGPGEVRIDQTAVGLNFIDVYMRSGLYPMALPAVLGMEGAGVVVEVGAGVAGLKEGDRVAYGMVAGSYAESRLIAADKLLKLPHHIDDRTAAAMMLKGLTAHYLLFRTYAVQPGDPILVTAAAGGVGQILCQWANHLGATVIGCVGSAEKAAIAHSCGARHTILYREEDIAQRVREITAGDGVAVVYDSVGQATFEAALDSLRPFGVMVTYGNASGPVEPFSPGILAAKGSLYVTRPTLATHVATRQLLAEGAERLFDMVANDALSIRINQSWPLARAADAHRALEARETTASSILEI